MPDPIEPTIPFVEEEVEEPEPVFVGDCFICDTSIYDDVGAYDEVFVQGDYVLICSPGCMDDYHYRYAECYRCEGVYHREDLSYSDYSDAYYCWDCGEPENDDPYSPSTTDDPTAAESALRIPSLTDRPTRLTSCEIEVGRGGNFLADAFHRAGLSEHDHMLGYHSGAEDFVRVEEDGSVAGEIILSKMRLMQRGHANMLEKCVKILKDAISDGESKLDMRCGLHIHINLGRDEELEIPCYSMESVENLYHLWNYVEDTVYRLGSANWSGHRSEHGNSYTPQIPKGFAMRHEIGQGMQHGRGALNLSPYLQSRGMCRCGAFSFGNWSDCTCRLGQSTVEFRVFNTTANTRKLRAYIALCQALVSFAERHTVRPAEYPVHGWTERSTCDVVKSKERLEFIMNELTLTNDERQDLLYCAEKSSLSAVTESGLTVHWTKFANQV